MVGFSSFRNKCCELYVHRKWPTQKFWHQTDSQVLKVTHSHLSYPDGIKKVIFSLSYNLGGTKYETTKKNTYPPPKGKRIDSPVWSFQTPYIKKRDPYSNSNNRYQSKTINQKQLPGYQNTPTWKRLAWLKKSFEKKKNREKQIFQPQSTSVEVFKRWHLSRIGLHQLRDAAEMSVVGRIVQRLGNARPQNGGLNDVECILPKQNGWCFLKGGKMGKGKLHMKIWWRLFWFFGWLKLFWRWRWWEKGLKIDCWVFNGGELVVTIECYLKCFNSLNQLEKSDETKNLLKNKTSKLGRLEKTTRDAACELLEWPKKKPQKYRKNMGNWETHQPRPLKVQILHVVFASKKKQKAESPNRWPGKPPLGTTSSVG